MFFQFSTEKTIQAVGVLLQHAKGRMCYLRLLKLLYIADRENLRLSRRPIIGSRIVAMHKGPIHSKVYDLIKGEHVDEPLWSKYFQKDGYEIKLLEDPGRSKLSVAEVRILTEISERYQESDEWDLVEITHKFPEWDKNFPDKTANTSQTISFEDLIDAVGLTQEKQTILDEAKEEAEIDRILASVHVS
jgi:uncharacterized phage-associated protein